MSTAGPTGGRAAAPVVRYTLLRLALFAALLAVGWLAGVRGVPLVLAAATVSAVASWTLLGRQRAAMVAAVQRRASRRAGVGSRAAQEDAWDEADRAQRGGEHGGAAPRNGAGGPAAT